MDDLGSAEDAQEQAEVVRGCAGLAYAGKTGYTYLSVSTYSLEYPAGAESVRRRF